MKIKRLFYLLFLCTLGGCAFHACGKDDNIPAEKFAPSPIVPSAVTSAFFATAFVEQVAPYDTPSDSDLWPSAWSDDDFLYAANGDGKVSTSIALTKLYKGLE